MSHALAFAGCSGKSIPGRIPRSWTAAFARLPRLKGPTSIPPDKPHAVPEAVYGQPRSMTGLFSSLSDTQRKSALAYRGEENH
jgi:hypothetical protein